MEEKGIVQEWLDTLGELDVSLIGKAVLRYAPLAQW